LTKKLAYPLPIKGALKGILWTVLPRQFLPNHEKQLNNYLAPCDCSKCGGARAAPAGVPLGEYDAAEGWRIIEGMRGGCYFDLRWPTASWRGTLLDKGDGMTKTAQDIIAGVEVLTIVTECYGGDGSGGTDKRGETKMTVLVGESGAMSIINAINAAGFVIVSNDALKAGSDGYG
jgi:hypothetical protein